MIGFIGNNDYKYGRSGIASIDDTLGQYCGPGSVIQVKTARTTAEKQSITSSIPIPIAGLSISFTPMYANSKIILRAYIATNARYVSSYGFYKDGIATCSTSGQTNSNAPNMQVTQWWFMGTGGVSTNVDFLENISVFWTEDAINTSTRIYDVRALSSWSTSNYNLLINNRNSNDMASFSFFSIMEVSQ